MFGNLIAASNVLEEEQLRRYKAVYCGLCRSLQLCFGQSARLTLNYDMSFLVLLLGSLYEPEELSDARRCPRHPFEAQAFAVSEISDYAANMNIAMAYLKCLDDWKDDKRLSALAESRTLAAGTRVSFSWSCPPSSLTPGVGLEFSPSLHQLPAVADL